MSAMNRIYQPHSLSLLTDLYQLTMAYGYWKLGMAERRAAFHLTFRSNPFGGGYSVCCGLHDAIDFINALRFGPDDLEYLASLRGNDERPLFESGFLDHLRRLEFSLDVDAIPEGTVVFPSEPLVRVTGSILQAQLIETPLLNIVNFQTLIATKAARVCQATGGEPVLEFGLRRAQGIDGGVSASRAAYVGGCDGTSNVLAGKLFGIPVRGTHAHSWVMCFEDELDAFDAYARVMPNNGVLLVDTYNTLNGVRHAVEIARRLRDRGHALAGIRLDSGDLAYLSIESRKILDEAGFPDVKILASNDLDEHTITSLRVQGARIDTWGVGTRLVTAHDQPALGGVYKLTAIADEHEPARWSYRLKLSEQLAKISTPGVLQVRRYRRPDDGELFAGDAIYNIADASAASDEWTIVDPADMTRRKTFAALQPHEELLVPVFRAGRQVYQPPPIDQTRARTKEQLGRLHPTIKRFLNPHGYPVGLEQNLHDLRTGLILKARQQKEKQPQLNTDEHG
jgi:nicotinate phosphoribosyltransferase